MADTENHGLKAATVYYDRSIIIPEDEKFVKCQFHDPLIFNGGRSPDAIAQLLDDYKDVFEMLLNPSDFENFVISLNRNPNQLELFSRISIKANINVPETQIWLRPSNKKIVKHVSGPTSSKIPLLHLIPRSAVYALAKRFEKGVRKHKEEAWNALSLNQESVMKDKEFLIERLSHGIDHCYKAIDRLIGVLPPLDEQDSIDGGDAGAIMFAGALLAYVDEYNRKEKDRSESNKAAQLSSSLGKESDLKL